ncbi:MAG: glycosyltransferase [Ruminococcus sp.]|nr:glycosyltransferase [Ruminococcus sp.]
MEKHLKKFSIITISYNAGESINKTVESVVKQGRKDIEYIFVDGDSTDDTKSIIKNNITILENIGISTKFVSEPDKGISDAFNKGILLAEGEIVIILNAADIMLNGTLTKIESEFTEGTDIVYGNVIFGDEDKNNSWVRKSQKEDALGKLKYSMVMQHPATYIKKNAYDKYGLYDISYKYCMDEELLYRFYLAGARFKYIDYTFTYMQSGGVSDGQIWKVLNEGMRIPLAYGDSFVKAKFIVILKFIRHELAHLYRRLFRGGTK